MVVEYTYIILVVRHNGEIDEGVVTKDAAVAGGWWYRGFDQQRL